jgi:hypothetical protein
MSRNIFISHTSSDRQLLENALEYLRSRRFLRTSDNVFYDLYDFASGEDFRGATREAIEGADAVFVIWSSAAAHSKWVNYELGMADALGKDLLLVVPHGHPGQIPANLQDAKVVELPDG